MTLERLVSAHCPDSEVPEDWEYEQVIDYVHNHLLPEHSLTRDDLWGKEAEEIVEYIWARVMNYYAERAQQIGEEPFREFEKVIVLRAVDSKWMDHIDAMDQLRQGIHLRAYGGTDPLREYQIEGFEMFNEMVQHIQEEVTQYVMKAVVTSNLERQEVAQGQTTSGGSTEEVAKKPVRVKESARIGRNDPCPCGSGKKYKACHGA